MLHRKVMELNTQTIRLLVILIAVATGFGLNLVFEIHNYRAIKIFGYLLILISTYLIYRATIDKKTHTPYSTLFRELERRQDMLHKDMEKTEDLLLDILPEPVAKRLKQSHDIIVDKYDDTTILFADIVGFTDLSSRIPAEELFALLNELFSAFDQLTEKYGLDKIKTSGDNYMVAGGISKPKTDHAQAVVEMALDMQKMVSLFNVKNDRMLKIRIGINTGPVIAGVAGKKKLSYDLWGDTVNIASRMETEGIEGCIQVTEATYRRLFNRFLFEDRGMVYIKNKGMMSTHLVKGRISQPENIHTMEPEALMADVFDPA